MKTIIAEIGAHLKKHRAPYIVAAILSLSTSLFLIIWNNWLFQFLGQRGEAIPRRALGAAIGLLILWLIVSVGLAIFYARKPSVEIVNCDHEALLGDLRSKIRTAEADKAALRSENGILYAQLQEASAENERLNNQIKELTHHDIDVTDQAIFRIIALSTNNLPWAGFIAEQLDIHVEEVKWHLNKLVKAKYLVSQHNEGLWQYSFNDKGREYAIKHKLLY